MDKFISVFTSDVVGSTKIKKYSETRLKELLESIENIVSKFKQLSKYQSYRGDAFQVTLENVQDSLRQAVLLRAFIIAQTPDELQYKCRYDVRISIGIGMNSEVLNDFGTAHIASGHGLDKMRVREKLSIETPWPDINRQLKLNVMMTDTIVSSWSKKEAIFMIYYLNNKSKDDIVRVLKIHPTRYSQLLKITNARLLTEILKYTNELIAGKL